ncbi:CD9 antigen isoform X2 [Cheilinus undulatus]|uniref:CD9 antigen isoform X2 n=1 Tax=Cheilinus undulatus TaxID=241271 RepID=UPI001BD2F4CB|nr:CD9 antigen isoform X2 [Cheilinus undulatus]
MALDGCGLFCKYMLIIFNIIFALVGFACLGFGLWLRFSNNTRGIFEIEAFSSTTFVIAVTVLIVLGSLMLLVVFFGDYGACNEKRCALQVFSVLLALMAVAAVCIGAITFSQRVEVGKHIAEFYTSLYALYVANGDPVIKVTLQFVHNMLHCCGVTGSPLVESLDCPKPNSIFENIVMPTCPAVIESKFDSQAPLVLGVFVGTGALLVIALVCSVILLKQLQAVHQEVKAYYRAVY